MTANRLNNSAHTTNGPDESIDWAAVYSTHERWMRTVVRARVGEPEAVDDVMQEVAIRVHGPHARPTDPQKVAPWLYRVAVRETINHRRRSGRQRRLTQLAVDVSQPKQPADPKEWVFAQELRQSVQAALNQLSAGDRELLLLKHTEGWSYRMLAEQLGVSIKTIERRLARARDAMRKQMMKAGYEEPSP